MRAGPGDGQGHYHRERGRRQYDVLFFLASAEALTSTGGMAEAQAAIDKLDVNGDGKVSYPEFILVMKFKK